MHIHTYICMHVYTYIYMCLCIYIHTFTCLYIHLHIHAYIYIHLHLYAPIYKYISLCASLSIYISIHLHTSLHIYIHLCKSIYIYIHLYMSIYIYVCLYICVHIYIYICIYIYIYTYIYICPAACLRAVSKQIYSHETPNPFPLPIHPTICPLPHSRRAPGIPCDRMSTQGRPRQQRRKPRASTDAAGNRKRGLCAPLADRAEKRRAPGAPKDDDRQQRPRPRHCSDVLAQKTQSTGPPAQ